MIIKLQNRTIIHVGDGSHPVHSPRESSLAEENLPEMPTPTSASSETTRPINVSLLFFKVLACHKFTELVSLSHLRRKWRHFGGRNFQLLERQN